MLVCSRHHTRMDRTTEQIQDEIRRVKKERKGKGKWCKKEGGKKGGERI